VRFGIQGWLFLAASGLVGEAQAQSASVGGYFRVAARPSFQGGSGRLGYWNLYGRLMNEGSYGMLDFRYDVLKPQPGTATPWTSLHARVEGGSIWSADSGNGNLAQFRMSQVYVRAGNVLLKDVVWQFGTLEYFFGDLGLYDFRPATVFFNTVGLSARYQRPWGELQLGFGDSGYALYRDAYNPVLTPGGTARFRLGKHVEVGGGGELFFESGREGHRHSPYQTPGIVYEDYVRGEVGQRYLEDYPGLGDFFPDPVLRESRAHNGVAYLGFGGWGFLRWNSFFLSHKRLMPEKSVQDSLEGEPITVYVHDFTDERFELTLGDEVQLRLWPDRLDAVWGAFYLNATDRDDEIRASERNRVVMSTVLRFQAYLTPTVHFLVENALAKERSKNGNLFREHADSLFANTGGVPDNRGLEIGDSAERNTWQGKFGFVINPTGPGIYARPSMRLLYGLQRSNQNNAFGNAFVESLRQYDDFDNVEQHLHHMVAAEAEVWF
jgi:hypothetical protein